MSSTLIHVIFLTADLLCLYTDWYISPGWSEHLKLTKPADMLHWLVCLLPILVHCYFHVFNFPNKESIKRKESHRYYRPHDISIHVLSMWRGLVLLKGKELEWWIEFYHVSITLIFICSKQDQRNASLLVWMILCMFIKCFKENHKVKITE